MMLLVEIPPPAGFSSGTTTWTWFSLASRVPRT
jgi:hypothetical protein